MSECYHAYEKDKCPFNACKIVVLRALLTAKQSALDEARALVIRLEAKCIAGDTALGKATKSLERISDMGGGCYNHEWCDEANRTLARIRELTASKEKAI